MSSTAEDGSRSISNVGLPRIDWESLFWTVFAASNNPMAIADANRRVVSANGALQRLLNRAEEDVVGRAIDESLPPADHRTIGDRWRAMLAAAKVTVSRISSSTTRCTVRSATRLTSRTSKGGWSSSSC